MCAVIRAGEVTDLLCCCVLALLFGASGDMHDSPASAAWLTAGGRGPALEYDALSETQIPESSAADLTDVEFCCTAWATMILILCNHASQESLLPSSSFFCLNFTSMLQLWLWAD